MSVVKPPDRPAMASPRAGSWVPIVLACCIVVVVLIAIVVVQLVDDDNPSTPRSALSALTTALKDGDIAGLQAASCDGWPSAAADVAPLGAIDTTFLLDGPTVEGGSGSATIGIGDDAPRTSPSPTTTAEALMLTADFEVAVGLSFVDDRWCVSSFTPTSAG